MSKCEQTIQHEQDCEEFFINLGGTFWTVDEANSVDCFEKEEYCFVRQTFVDELTATDYLNQKGFGGILYNPANIPKTILPVLR